MSVSCLFVPIHCQSLKPCYQSWSFNIAGGPVPHGPFLYDLPWFTGYIPVGPTKKKSTKNTMDSPWLLVSHPYFFTTFKTTSLRRISWVLGVATPNHEKVSHVWPWVSIETHWLGHWLTMTYETPISHYNWIYNTKLYYIYSISQ